jgi:antitoxin FitA
VPAVANLTLKNIPDPLHALLRESAERNRRSLNSEILVRLESGFVAPLLDAREEARILKAFTDAMPAFDHGKVGRFKAQGRP